MSSHGVTRLRLLGAPAIDGPAANGQAVLKQPKRLLLLAYLAAHDEFVTRDALLGLFWPTLTEDRARRALSQAIHFLRSELGRGAILTRGSTEIAAGGDIPCDVQEFERAIKQESWEAALDFYGGELLCGVIPPHTHELEQWLESERAKLRRQATKAANTLSNEAFQAGNLASAIAWRRRTLEISPFDEEAHRDYLALLDEAGDATGALAAYEAFRTSLREVYELEPSDEMLRVVDLIRTRHSRSARPESASDPSIANPAVAAVTGGPGHPAADLQRANKSHRRWRSLPRIPPSWRPVRISAVVTVLALTTVFASVLRRPTRGWGPPLIHNRVAVLYLNANSELPEIRHLADGLTEALIGYLGQAQSLEVVSANGVRAFRGLAPPLDTIIGRLRAQTIIDGAVSRSGGITRVTIQVIDAEDGSVGPQIVVSSAGSDLLQIIDEVTAKVAGQLSPQMGDVVMLGRWRAGTENALALEHVLRATGLQKSGDWLADHGSEPEARKAYEAADRELIEATLLDPDWLEPAVLRGDLDLGMAWFCIFKQCEDGASHWLDRAIAHADAALAVNGAHAGAAELRGRALLQKWMVEADPDPALRTEAEAALIGATTVDQSRASAWAALSAAYFARGDFEGAETTAKRALEEDAFLADRAEIQMRLFQSAFHREHDGEAASWCDAVWAFQRVGNWMGADCRLNLMAWSPQSVPNVREAWREVERGLQHAPSPTVAIYRPRLNLLVAAVLARVGEQDSARNVITRALAEAPSYDVDAFYYAAAAYAAMGDTVQALDNLSKFLKDAPDNRQHVVSFRWFSGVAPLLDLPVSTSRGG